MAAERTKIDWEAVEPVYRAGKLSVREIARMFGCSEKAIRLKAKDKGWERDLSAKIDKAVRTKLLRNELRTADPATEKGIIEANAQAILTVRLDHRKDISRAKGLSLRLLDELDEQTIGREMLADLGDILRSPDDKGMDRLNDIYKKIIATPSRIDSIKKLSDTLKTLIGLEREAWGITDGSLPIGAATQTADPYEGLPNHLLDMIHGVDTE